MTFAGQAAWITGASSGIGAALARGLAAQGARVVLSGRNVAALDAVAADCPQALVLPFETTDFAAIGPAAEQAWGWAGGIDLLVNNAGISQRSLAQETDFAVYQKIIDVDLLAPIALTQALLPHMVARGSGRIVNLSSIGASITAAGTGVYGGLKRALEAFTDVLRIELAGSGVRVGLVAPGTTSTEIFADMKAHGQPGWDEFIPAMVPDDVARAVLFLCEQTGNANAARLHLYATAEGF